MDSSLKAKNSWERLLPKPPIKYIKIVFPPILDSFFVSDREATPKTKEANTNGTAMSLSKLINIVPKGAIQLVVNVLQPLDALITPYINPKTNPRMIFQCSASFFICDLAMYH